MNQEKIDKEHIEKRIEDWKNRINNLFNSISVWLENSKYNIKEGSKIPMFEMLMSEFEIPPTELKSINVFNRNTYVLSIKPKGLWIIGANGRIDILSLMENYIIVDIAEQFQEPIWKVYRNDRKKKFDFNQETFNKILNQAL